MRATREPLIFAMMLAMGSISPAAEPTHAPTAHRVGPDEAIHRLIDGNARFMTGEMVRPRQDAARRWETAGAQAPFAAVLSCADSRVPVEMIFDAGIGDLFVVRVAGNVGDTDEIGTLEYGVEHVGINAIVVLGHTKCGAVTAVVEGAHVTPNIAKLVDNIVPAAEAARSAYPYLKGAPLVGKAIEYNVKRAAEDLVHGSDLLKSRVQEGTLRIIGAVYDVKTGEVEWLDATPLPAVTPAVPHAGHGGTHAEPPTIKEPAGHGSAGHSGSSRHEAKESHAEPTTRPADPGTHVDAAPVEKKENFVALGGLLGASAMASTGVLWLMRKK